MFIYENNICFAKAKPDLTNINFINCLIHIKVINIGYSVLRITIFFSTYRNASNIWQYDFF